MKGDVKMFNMTIKSDDEEVDDKFTVRGKNLGILMIKIAVLSMDYQFCYDIKEAVNKLYKRKGL